MKLIQPQCRDRLSAQDFEFLLSALNADGGGADCGLHDLLSSDDSRDHALDHPAIFERMMRSTDCINISSRLFFYVLIRHALVEENVDDRDVADYIAEMLNVFSQQKRVSLSLPGMPPSNYLFEMLSALLEAAESTRFQIRAHMGNHTLFFSGLFPEFIEQRAERRGSPSVSFYEGMGRTSYRIARDHPLAQRHELAEIFDTLSARFGAVRKALNIFSDRLVFMNYPGHLLTE